MPNFNSVDQLLMQALLGAKPYHVNAATAVISAAVHTTGTGLNDATSGGTFTDILDHVYRVKIATASGTDQIQISVDGGAYGSATNITGSAQSVGNGITITFAATTGHTLGDIWTITVTAGVVLASASQLKNLAQNAVGSGATLALYDGANSSGTLLYKGLTANWTAGQLSQLPYFLQNSAGLYVVLYASSSYPDLIVGYL